MGPRDHPGNMYSKLMSTNSQERNAILAVVLVELIISLEVVNCLMLRDPSSKTNTIERFHGPTSIYAQKKFNELNAAKERCKSAEEDLDRCGAQLISLSNTIYPTSMDEVDSMYCPNFRRAVECVKNASECYRPFERQVISWILTSTRKLNYKRCRSEPEKAKFLKLCDGCFSSMKDSMDTCMADYIANLDAIAQRNRFIKPLSKEDIQIQLSCCANSEFKRCMLESARQRCKPTGSQSKLKRTSSLSSNRAAQKFLNRESEEMIEDLKNTLDSMTLTGPELVCRSVTREFCQSKFNANPKKPSGYRSIVPSLLKIYANK